jgi:hypothetical protein
LTPQLDDLSTERGCQGIFLATFPIGTPAIAGFLSPFLSLFRHVGEDFDAVLIHLVLLEMVVVHHLLILLGP